MTIQRIIALALALLGGALPVAAVAQGTPIKERPPLFADGLPTLIAKLDAVLAANMAPEATAAILGSSLAATSRDVGATMLADTEHGPHRLSGIGISSGPYGNPRIGLDVSGPCITSQDASSLFPAAQWSPYPDRDPAKFNQLVETRIGDTIKLVFALSDGCLAAISAEKLPPN